MPLPFPLLSLFQRFITSKVFLAMFLSPENPNLAAYLRCDLLGSAPAIM